jgi:hypothetical protein
MKKLFFLAILPLMMAVVTLSSCSKDEDNGGADNEILVDFNYPENQLFGVWKVIEMDGKTPGNSKESTVVISNDGTCIFDGHVTKYTATGSLINIFGYYDKVDFSFAITSWEYPVVEGIFTEYEGSVPDVYEVVVKKVEK